MPFPRKHDARLGKTVISYTFRLVTQLKMIGKKRGVNHMMNEYCYWFCTTFS